MDELDQAYLTLLLWNLEENYGNPYVEAKSFSKMEHVLRFEESEVHALNVSRFLDLVADLSVEAMDEMHFLAEQTVPRPAPLVVAQQDGGLRDVSSTSSTRTCMPGRG